MAEWECGYGELDGFAGGALALFLSGFSSGEENYELIRDRGGGCTWSSSRPIRLV